MEQVTKTAEDIQGLKDAWRNDPCWDLENTEGFEDHYEELLAYRKKCQDYWDTQADKKLAEKAEKMGIPNNLILARYIQLLEFRIEKLENEMIAIGEHL